MEVEIRLVEKAGADFICVTDIAKFNSSEPGQVVRNYFQWFVKNLGFVH
jgi:hypothetical protein